MNHPTENPEPTNAAWEEAMSRDFDARVRDLHEAPLDFQTVKGRARKIRRNRRVAVAGGVLGVAAAITPVAVLVGNNAGTNGTEDLPVVDRTPDSSETTVPDPTGGDPDHLLGGVWHQGDGDQVRLPRKDYSDAVVWDGYLVASRWDGEVFYVADVIGEDGQVVDSFETTAPVAVDDSGTTIAWVATDGEVMTRWPGGEVSMGTVDLAAAGETVAYSVAAVTGGPSCLEAEDGCTVYVDSGVGEPRTFDSHGVNDNPVPGVVDYGDASDAGLVSYRDEIDDDGSCGGVVDVTAGSSDPLFHGCDFEAEQISPDSQHLIGLPAYYDGLGISEVTVRDARTGAETGRYAPEGGFVSQWTWTADGRVLFDAFDGAQWHLLALQPDGTVEEVAEPAAGEEFDSPFTLVRH